MAGHIALVGRDRVVFDRSDQQRERAGDRPGLGIGLGVDRTEICAAVGQDDHNLHLRRRQLAHVDECAQSCPRGQVRPLFEQLQRRQLTPAVDFYALGIVAFRIFTAQWPFDGDGAWDRALARVTREPARLSRFTNVPPALERLIDGLLRGRPESRISDAAEARHMMRSLMPL